MVEGGIVGERGIFGGWQRRSAKKKMQGEKGYGEKARTQVVRLD